MDLGDTQHARSHHKLLPLLKGEVPLPLLTGPGAGMLGVEDDGAMVPVLVKADTEVQGDVFVPVAEINGKPGDGVL